MSKQEIRSSNRSGNEKCPICDYHGSLVEHHINGRKVPKWNKSWNIVYICPNCHDQIHFVGDLAIIKWIMTDKGKQLIYVMHGKTKMV